MTEPVQKRLCPLILLNGGQEIDSEVNMLVGQLNSQKFVYKKNDELGSTSTAYLRFMTIEKFILEYADIKHSRTSLACKEIWDRFRVSDPAAFIAKSYHHVNTEIAYKILDGIMNDGLTTFDHPVAIINFLGEDAEANGVIRDRVGDLAVRPSLELDISIGTDVPDLSLDSWTTLISKSLSDDIVPYSTQLLADITNKSQSKAMQNTFGFATKLFSMSKKYLTQTNSSLTTLKHSEETVVTVASTEIIGSTSSLRESEFQLRRAADLSFMLQNYRQASTLYDSLRKDAQTSKNWLVTASAHQWSLISRLLAGVSSSLPAQDLDQIVQQYLLSPEPHFSATHLVTVLSILSVPIQILFPLLSRIIQSKTEPMWKLAPLVLQIHTAVVIKKNRMALLLVDIFSFCCDQLGLTPIALMSLRVAHLLIDPCLQSYFAPLYMRLLNLSQQLEHPIDRSIAKVLLSNSTKLDMTQVVACWKSVSESHVVVNVIKIVSVNIQERPCETFDLHDFDMIKGFTEMLWNCGVSAVDPLDLLVQTQETIAALGKIVHVEILVANVYPFPIRIRESHLEIEAPMNVNVTWIDSNVTLSANSVQSLSFSINCDYPETVKLETVRITTDDYLVFRAPLPSKGFRLNSTKSQRVTPTYSEFHGNHIRYLTNENFVEAEFKFLGGSASVALHQECIFELTIGCLEEKKVNIAILSGNLAPLDHSTCKVGDIEVLKDLRLEASKVTKVLFKSLIDTTGPIDFVLALYSTETTILRRVKVCSSPLVPITGINYHGFNQTTDKLVSMALINGSHESLKVFETSLGIAGSSVGALGLASFDLRPETPFTITFPLTIFSLIDAALTLRLQDGRILHIPIALSPPTGPVVTYNKAGAPRLSSGYSAQPVKATVKNARVFTIEASDTVVLGEVCRHQRDPEQDITMNITMLSVDNVSTQ